MTDPVRVAPSGPDDHRLWRLVREFADVMTGLPWALIGGLMVRAVEAEHGVGVTNWTTIDLDAVLDVRADPFATEEASRRLIGVGFEPARAEPGIVYRFTRGDDVVDVLARDHIGRRARLVTVPPDQTLQGPALDRPSAGAATWRSTQAGGRSSCRSRRSSERSCSRHASSAARVSPGASTSAT